MYFNDSNKFFHGIMFHHFHDDLKYVSGQGSITKNELIKIINFLGRKNILNPNESFNFLKSNKDGCVHCEKIKEKFNKICVVEDIADQWSIENSNIYKGYYHILGGTISSVGRRKEDLLINALVERIKRDNIEEVILATSATVEGQTTAYYIQDSLKD